MSGDLPNWMTWPFTEMIEGKIETPSIPKVEPPKVEEKVAEAITPEAQAQTKETEKKKLSSKKKNTILTGPLGILSESPTEKKTLLGQ